MSGKPYIKDTTKTYAGLRDVPISKKLKPSGSRLLFEGQDNS